MSDPPVGYDQKISRREQKDQKMIRGNEKIRKIRKEKKGEEVLLSILYYLIHLIIILNNGRAQVASVELVGIWPLLS